MPYTTRPPYILIKTWFEIYCSNSSPEYEQARIVVKDFILQSFDSLYEAEMYLFHLEQLRCKRKPIRTLKI